MNLFEIALISLALAFSTSGICFAAVNTLSKPNAGITLRFLFLLVLTQIIFSFIGLILGTAISRIFPSAIHWIALSVLIMMGLKILIESFQEKPQDWAFDITDLKVALKLSLAASIEPFIVSTGLGLFLPNLPNSILIIGATFLLFCSAWLIVGRAREASPFKFRLRQTGGLILLAAGIHLFLKLI